MNQSSDTITKKQLSEQLVPICPEWVDFNEAFSGTILALQNPEERKRPIERGLGEDGVVYAWREEDASATKLAFEVLGNLGAAFVNGPIGISDLGFALKDLVYFLIDLNKHRVRISDPLEVTILLMLKSIPGGLTSGKIFQSFVEAHGIENSPELNEVENALEHLANAHSSAGAKQLVRADGQRWMSLV